MGRHADIARALSDALELRLLAIAADSPDQRDRLNRLAQRRLADAGPTVPKSTAARLLKLSRPTLENWIERVPLRTHPSSRRFELDARQLLEVACTVERERAERGTAHGLIRAARERVGKPRMGEPGFFVDHAHELRDEFSRTTPGERIALGIELSRQGTRLAAIGLEDRQ